MSSPQYDENDPNRIADYFTDRSIFVTGGTGFLGRVLIEKLLRVCTGLKTIYVLIRPKWGKETNQRLDEIYNSPLFGKLRAENPDMLKKIVPIIGDVAESDLGMSAQDRKVLIENVSVVYHVAATIKFDEPLKKAVLLNTRGTKLVLELAKEMSKLEVFMHVSTAYCHTMETELEEKTYPPPADPHKIIKCVEWMDDDVVEAMTAKLIGNLPNTYAFSKNLAEGIVAEQMDKMPVIITRPSIIIPIWKDPLPGWTDNMTGPTGLLIGAGKGVIRTMYCKYDGYADFVPVDVCVNGLLIGSWHIGTNKAAAKRVYNITSSTEFQITWDEIIERGRRITKEVPLNWVVWYPGGSMKKSRLMHNISFWLFHMLPAYFIDFLLLILGFKPIMLRVQRKISKGFEIFEYYANNQWYFHNANGTNLRYLMNKRERATFVIEGTDLDIDDYFTKCVYAAREYILKEPIESLPTARRHLRIMYWVDKVTKFLFYCFCLYLLASWSSTVRYCLQAVFGLLCSVFSLLPGNSSVATNATDL